MRHRPILEVVLGYLNDDLPKVAIDCSCGAGNEVQFLLDQGFTVYVISPNRPKKFVEQDLNMLIALSKNGIFAYNLLGINDAWVEESPHVFLGFNEQQLKDLFSEYFDIVYLDHLQEERPLASGLIKFWDIFTVILKKK